LIPSYSLWDIVSYAVEHGLSTPFYKSDQSTADQKRKRFREIAQRFYPLLNLRESCTVFRRLLKYKGRDVARAVEKEGILILSIPCEFKENSPKGFWKGTMKKWGSALTIRRFWTSQEGPYISRRLPLSPLSERRNI